PASHRRAPASRLLAEILPGRGGRSRWLPAARPDHGMGHGGGPRCADCRRRLGDGPRRTADAIWQAGLSQRKLYRLGQGRRLDRIARHDKKGGNRIVKPSFKPLPLTAAALGLMAQAPSARAEDANANKPVYAIAYI